MKTRGQYRVVNGDGASGKVVVEWMSEFTTGASVKHLIRAWMYAQSKTS
jgi:hypothetical protein